MLKRKRWSWLWGALCWVLLVSGCGGTAPTESTSDGVTGEHSADGGTVKEGVEGVFEGSKEQVGAERQACSHLCDCAQGEQCLGGFCTKTTELVYCCDRAGCVPGAACRSPRTGEGKCGEEGRTCRSVCDCSSGLACSNGQCSALGQKIPCCSRTGDCKDGDTCQRYDGSIGVCGEKPACQQACDCKQGEGCVQGRCVGGESPVYCCAKPGCPEGEACKQGDGSSSTCAKAPSCVKDQDCGASGCEQDAQGCVEIKARCVGGSCQVDRTPKKGSCDKASGLCVEGPACQADKDCGPLACQQDGKYCEVSTSSCVGGACLKRTKKDVGTCNNSGACVPPASCTTLCDCPQGQYCVEGKCFQSSFPGFCCENPGCPGGETCYTSFNTADQCPILCKSPCDCPEGYDCANGKCFRGPSPMYCCDQAQSCPPGATCKAKDNKAGTCAQQPRPCRSSCDCVQGEACLNGQCSPSAQPTFCCDKEGCPQGQGCENKNLQSGICPAVCTTLCDCPQGQTCIAGRCNQDPGLGGGYCCSNPGCPLGQVCYQANGQAGRCAAKTCGSPCDCPQGEDCRNGVCTPTSPPVYCCSKAGCAQGSRCREANNQWGTCQNQATCQSPCDCAQGEDCYRGQCVGTFPSVYCCSKVGCPQGQACYNAQNQAGLCPTASCQSACDCPHQGQSCIRGRCTIVTSGATIYCCDKAFCPPGNSCEDAQGNLKYCSQQSCQNACDCNQGEDCQNGACVYVQPPVLCCSKPFCQAGAPCIRQDGTSSTCGTP